jgi:membrane-associated protease RseP (regulator of RpoE activity)
MPRERLGPWIAAGVIAVIAVAGVTALVVQAFDDDDSSDGQLLSIERDGTKLRLELDLGPLGIDEDDLDALEEGDLSLLRALLARIGFADEDLDFEPGGLGALRDLFGDRDGELRGDALRQLLQRMLREGERDLQPRPGPLLDRFRFDGPVFPDDAFPFRFDQGPLLGVGLNDQLVVQQVAPGSPAAEAGVEVGDAIRSVDGEPVADVDALREAIAAVEPGASYELGIARGDAALTLDVTRPETIAGAIDGQRLRELIEGLRSGRIELEDVPPQLRPLLEQFALPELAPRPAPPRS